MRTAAIVLGIILALVASAAVLAALTGAEAGDVDTARLVQLAVVLGMTASAVVFAARQNWSQAIITATVWGALFVLLIIGYANRAVFQDMWAGVMAELSPGTAVARAGAVEIRRAPDTHFHVSAKVNGATVELVVDTGASDIALSWAAARAAGLNPDALSFDAPIMTANGPAFGARARIASIEVGPIVRRDLPVLVLPKNVPESLLGLGFLDTLTSYEVRRDTLVLTD